MRVLREELSPYACQLVLCRHVRNGVFFVLVYLLQAKDLLSDVLRAQAVGDIPCNLQGSTVVANVRYTFEQLSKSKLGRFVHRLLARDCHGD